MQYQQRMVISGDLDPVLKLERNMCLKAKKQRSFHCAK